MQGAVVPEVTAADLPTCGGTLGHPPGGSGGSGGDGGPGGAVSPALAAQPLASSQARETGGRAPPPHESVSAGRIRRPNRVKEGPGFLFLQSTPPSAMPGPASGGMAPGHESPHARTTHELPRTFAEGEIASLAEVGRKGAPTRGDRHLVLARKASGQCDKP